MEVSTTLKEYRDATNASYKEIAHALGVSEATVQSWIAGRHQPNTNNQQKLESLMMREKTEQYKPVTLDSGDYAIDSRLVADMVEKEHSNLLKDIRRYISYMNDDKEDGLKVTSPRKKHSAILRSPLKADNYFIPSTYTNEQNKEQPCYLITKKGCDLLAHKMTGQRGVVFTARYIDLFYEMERQLAQPVPAPRTPRHYRIARKPKRLASYTPSQLDCAYIDKLVEEVKQQSTVTSKYLKLEEITLIAQRMEQVRGVTASQRGK